MKFRHFLLGATLVTTTGLNLPASPATAKDTVSVAAPGGATAERVTTESAKANAFFDRVFDEGVDRSPSEQGYLGIKKDHDKWDDYTEEHELAELGHTVQDLTELKRTINPGLLNEQTQMSYRLFVTQSEHTIEGWKWRNHGYVFNQMEDSPNSSLPAFLINYHPVDNVADARAYVTRLQKLPAALDQLMVRAHDQAAHGVLPPKFVFPLMIESCHEIIKGAPFDTAGPKSALLEDFEGKVGALKDADAATKAQLLAAARAALADGIKPAYERLIALFEVQAKTAGTDDGSWKLPEGLEYYNFMLRSQTTTALSADEIHELGLREVARIHAEMTAIKEKTGFKGDLPAFLKFMRDDPQFVYPSTAEGRTAYIKRATGIIDEMRLRLPEFFGVQPKAGLVIKKVEPFREKNAAGAFYEQPSADGTRPGTYYIATLDMRGLPIWEMETLAHHEAIPGHHMQIAIAQELDHMPKFRMYGGYVAYAEGWALYAERFPKEFGFYSDPYQDFGRLSDELLRAVRLVVDTGIHAKHWTRQQVRDYFFANTANPERDVIAETDRYIVWPGQACGYKIGQLKILELRELAKKELGARFSLRDYHDLVLKNGALPMNLLEENVRNWIAKQKG